MELADKWYNLKNINYEDEPGKSYYKLHNIKYSVYGKGNVGKCNTVIESFFRINNMNDRINTGENYCSNPIYKELYDKLIPTISEYIVNKFDNKLSNVTEQSEKQKIRDLSEAYQSYYETSFTGIEDIDMMILSNLSDFDLDRACKTNKYLNSLCTNDKFYKYKIDKKLEQLERDGEILPGEIDSIRNVIHDMYGKHNMNWNTLYLLMFDDQYYLPMEYSDMFYSIKDIRKYLGYPPLRKTKFKPWSNEVAQKLRSKDMYLLMDSDVPVYDKESRRVFPVIKVTDEIRNDPKYKGYYIVPSLRVFGKRDNIISNFVSLGIPEGPIRLNLDYGSVL